MPTATRSRSKTSPKTSRARKPAPKPRAKQPAKRAAASRRTRKPGAKSAGARTQRLASWEDLSSAPPPRRTGSAPRDLIETITREQFLALFFAIAVLGTLYVHHTYATDRALTRVQAERAAHERLTMQRSRLQAELAAASSPQVILPRAQALGLEEGIAYGPVISRGTWDVGSGK